MAWRRAFLGALLVVALVCALGAAGASAITLHACEEGGAGATAQEYTGGTCETKGAGKFRTVPIGMATLTTPTLVTNQVISATIGAVTVEIVCTGLGGSGKGEDVTIGEAKFAFVNLLKIKYFECTVPKPKGGGCVLKTAEPPIETTSLKLNGIQEGGALKAELFPEAGITLAKITLEKCSMGSLNAERSLTGEARAVVGVDPSILEFTPTSGSKLELGGNPASYTGDIRLFMEGTTKRMAFALP
jgi:hypothetical protein